MSDNRVVEQGAFDFDNEQSESSQLSTPRLVVELVPESCWWSNVRTQVTPSQWNRIRRAAYKAAHYRCEICGGKGPRWPVECHEVWQYEWETMTQRLVRMIALCPNCHRVKHIGLAEIQGYRDVAVSQLCTVNGWTLAQAEEHIAAAWEVYNERSQFWWKLDIAVLARYGVHIGS